MSKRPRSEAEIADAARAARRAGPPPGSRQAVADGSDSDDDGVGLSESDDERTAGPSRPMPRQKADRRPMQPADDDDDEDVTSSDQDDDDDEEEEEGGGAGTMGNQVGFAPMSLLRPLIHPLLQHHLSYQRNALHTGCEHAESHMSPCPISPHLP